MGDIVATIQAEQDAIIRSELPNVRVVRVVRLPVNRGGSEPRGLSAVHKIRERLSRRVCSWWALDFFHVVHRACVAFAGRNRRGDGFAGDPVPGLRAVPEEDRAVAALKGDLRMVKVIKRAVADRLKVPARAQL